MDFLTTLLGIFSGGGLGGGEDLLPGKVFTPIAAAFATQGYFAHAEILDLLAATSFQHYAVFVYMCAIIMALCGMALGSPPKFYLWFIMGPVVFHFLIGTTQDVYGNAWAVAGEPQEQNEVWKLVEAGMTGSPFLTRSGVRVTANGGPSSPVAVSWFFAKLDGLISDTVQELTKWLGVYTKGGSDGTATADSNITKAPTEEKIKWYLLSNLKWGFLDTITSARLSSPELRDAFFTFLAGSCGDSFYSSIDDGRYGAATRSTDGSIPRGVFRTADSTSNGASYTTNPSTTYKFMDENLKKISVAVPLSMRRLLLKGATVTSGSGSGTGASSSGTMWRFRDALPERIKTNLDPLEAPAVNLGSITFAEKTIEALMSQQSIKCNRLLDLIMLGFRWEAAQVYGALALNTPSGLGKPEVLDYVMLHGWDVRIKEDPWKTPTANDIGGFKLEGEPLDTTAKRREYLVGLILVNMLKNEFVLAPNPAMRRIQSVNTSTQQASNAVDFFQKTIGQRNKYGEVYTWAKMMPYLQGVLLYILAIGYPFACIFVLIPGWHKIIFTWSSFWIWAKIWDLGFAIVVVLERSIWATIGNSAKASKMNPFIAQMWNWGETQVINTAVIPIPPFGFAPIPLPPEAWKIHIVEKAVNGAADMPNVLSYMYLDRAMTLFTNMDLDLQNSYYIYIMAALYFAVPAVTGQLVLGAKAGVAGLVTNAFTQMAQETGAKAGQDLNQRLQQQLGQATNANMQAVASKALTDRTKGMAGAFAASALDAEFHQTMDQTRAAKAREVQTGLQAMNQVFGSAQNFNRGNLTAASAIAGQVPRIMSGGLNPIGLLAMTTNQRAFDMFGSLAGLNGATGSFAANAAAMKQGGGTFADFTRTYEANGGKNAGSENNTTPPTVPSAVPTGRGVRAEGVGSSSGQTGGGGVDTSFLFNQGGPTAGNVNMPMMPPPMALGGGPLAGNFASMISSGMQSFIGGSWGGIGDLMSQAGQHTFDTSATLAQKQTTLGASDLAIAGYAFSRDAELAGVNAQRDRIRSEGALQDQIAFDMAQVNQDIMNTGAASVYSLKDLPNKSNNPQYLAYTGLGGQFNTTYDGENVDLTRYSERGAFLDRFNASTAQRFRDTFGSSALEGIWKDYALNPEDVMNFSFGRAGYLFKAMGGAGALDMPGKIGAGLGALTSSMPGVPLGFGRPETTSTNPGTAPSGTNLDIVKEAIKRP